MQLCSDESLAVDEDGERDIEDLRTYWFDSLANLDDARVRPRSAVPSSKLIGIGGRTIVRLMRLRSWPGIQKPSIGM